MKEKLLPILKTVLTSVLGMLITALVQQYAPKITVPAAGAAVAAAAVRKSTLEP